THELSYVLNDSELRAVATNDLIDHHVDLAGILADAVVERPPRLRHLIALGGRTPDGFVGRAAFDRAAAHPPPGKVVEARTRALLRDEAMLLYTSGTTANPKGCVLTHEALVRTGMAAAERWELTSEERFWNPLPMFHMGGVFPLLAHLHVGATIVTMTHFEP